MTISKCDLVALVVLIVFAVFGYKKGAIEALINLVGLIASFIVAWLLSSWLTELLMGLSFVKSALTSWLGSGSNQTIVMNAVSKVGQILIFVLLLILILAIVGRIKKKMRKINKVPIVGTVNKIAGGIVGIVTGAVLVSVIIGILYYFAGFAENTTMQEFLSSSAFLQLFQTVTQ